MRHDDRSLIAIVPRFVGDCVARRGRLPLGAELGDARVILRHEWRHQTPRNALTGELVRPAVIDGQLSLRVADLFANCPVALLVTRDLQVVN